MSKIKKAKTKARWIFVSSLLAVLSALVLLPMALVSQANAQDFENCKTRTVLIAGQPVPVTWCTGPCEIGGEELLRCQVCIAVATAPFRCFGPGD
jgi:hypothetical protein